MYFNDSGRFTHNKDIVFADGNGRREDLRLLPDPNDPIQETVFISAEALKTLLRKATSIFCVFLSPDNSFTQREVYTQKQMHPPTEDTTGTEFSDNVQDLSEGRHLYWQNQLRCRVSGCISLDTKAV